MKALKTFIRNNCTPLFVWLENQGFNMVVEMAQVNTYDNSNSYFPWNKYKLCIYGDDHNPAHFHIISKQEKFDIRVDCKTGDLVSVKKYGKRKEGSHFSDIVKDVKKWLDEPCSNPDLEGKDNRDMIRIHWNANNPSLSYTK